MRRGGSEQGLIERSFEDSALARATLQLGDTFGLDVVAEGIETREQLDALKRLGCRLAQGYFLGRLQLPTGWRRSSPPSLYLAQGEHPRKRCSSREDP